MSYILMDYTGAEDDLRSIFGVTSTELSNELIHSLPILPTAEMLILDQLSSDITAATDKVKHYIKLAILYKAAAASLVSLKVNTLQREDDNKTSGQRFKDALALSEADLLSKSDKFLNQAKIELSDSSAVAVNLFEVSQPATDVITGD